MSKESLYVPKNVSNSSLITIIDARISQSGGGSGSGDVTLNGVQTLTNKNLTSATNSFPSSLATLTNAQTLTNKDLTSATNSFPSTLSTSSNSQIFTNKDLTSVSNTFPSSLATLTNAQILTNKDLTSATNTFPTSLVDLTNAQTLTNKNLTSATNTFPTSLVDLSTTQTLTNKNLTSGTNSFPSSLVDLTSSQVLTNKNLTSGTNTFPSSLATLTSVQTLSNKTLSGPIISSIVNSGTISLPTTTSFLLSTLNQWPTLQNPGICLVDGTTISASNQFLGISFRTGNNTINDIFSTAGQSNIADMYLAQRTHSTTALTQTYANCATLWIQNAPLAGTNVTITNSDAIRVENSNVRIANGRLLSSSLGTAALPSFAIGTLLTDGIFSSAAGTINITTAGVLRTTINASGLVLSANSAISTSGTGTITSGSGGFTSSGPLACSGASTVTTCAVRPTNNANTGIFGTAATNVSIAVGGTAVISCTTTTTSITGALTVSNITTGGHKVSAIGTSTLQEVRGSVVISAVIPMGTFYNHGSVLFTGSVSFSSTPNMILTINQEPVGGFWDQCSVTTITRGVTSFTIGMRNNSLSSTNGSCTVSYVAWV